MPHRCPALLAECGPAPTRTSLCSVAARPRALCSLRLCRRRYAARSVKQWCLAPAFGCDARRALRRVVALDRASLRCDSSTCDAAALSTHRPSCSCPVCSSRHRSRLRTGEERRLFGVSSVRGTADGPRALAAPVILVAVSRLFRDVNGGPLCPHGSVVCIGAFDGLHLGHQALVGRARARARELGCASAVLSFEPLPREFFARGAAPARLLLPAARIQDRKSTRLHSRH